MIGAYIAVVLGVAIWSLMTLVGRSFSAASMRAITVFGGAFLLAVCFLDLVPEMAEGNFGAPWLHCGRRGSLLPFVAVLVGFLVQQLLETLSSHAEHGHIEGSTAVAGLMMGLCLHAFLEGMPLVAMDGEVNRGLLYGILLHNIPVALILVGLMTSRGYRFARVLILLVLFGIMSPLGSLFNLYILQPQEDTQRVILGLVVGVLLHVSSSILFDHKQHGSRWLNIGVALAAFVLVYFIV